SQHRAAQGPADERCHHRVSQGRVPLSQTESAKDSGHYLFAPPMNSLVRECRSPGISWIMTLLTGASLYGEEDQACSKAPSQAPEASGIDETTNPRTQGSLARKDTRCGNLEADQANARRVTAEGAPTRIAAWTFLASELTPSKVPKSYRLFPRLFFRFLSGLCEPRQPLCKFIAAG